MTIAAAAMIIGKKGLMLKQLQAKSAAAISLDQVRKGEGWQGRGGRVGRKGRE